MKKKYIFILAFLLIILCLIVFKLINPKGIIKKNEEKRAENIDEYINMNIDLKEKTEEEYKVLLTFTSNDQNEYIKSIKYPNNENTVEIANVEGNKKISIDYIMPLNDADRTFEVTTISGKTENKRTGYRVIYNDNYGNVFEETPQLKGFSVKITSSSPEKKEGKHFIGFSPNRDATIPDYFENGENTDYINDTILYALYVDENSGNKTTISNDSLIGKTSQINTSGIQNITVNGVTYSANVIVVDNDLVLDGKTEVEGAVLKDKTYEFGNAEQDVAKSATDYAKNMVILKVNGNLTIDNNVNVTSCKNEYGYGGPKGMFIYATGTFTNNGHISMTERGAYAEGQDVYLWKNSSDYEYVPKTGALGGEVNTEPVWSNYRSGAINGLTGENGQNRQTGGGASGGSGWYDGSPSTKGKGEDGTSYSGGSGGSGAMNTNGEDGNENGGSGGNAQGWYYWGQRYGVAGGAGNPGGKGIITNYGYHEPSNGQNGTGGLLIIYAEKIKQAGIIESKGSIGGKASIGGGSSGGGSINIFYQSDYENNGLMTAAGGEKSGKETDAWWASGEAGGDGTITIGSVETGNFVKETYKLQDPEIVLSESDFKWYRFKIHVKQQNDKEYPKEVEFKYTVSGTGVNINNLESSSPDFEVIETFEETEYQVTVQAILGEETKSTTITVTTPSNLMTPYCIYDDTTFNQDIFSANYSDGSPGGYAINQNGVLEIYGAYCNRCFASFEVDLTNYEAIYVEWNSQSTTGTLGCVLSERRKNFGAPGGMTEENGIIKCKYNPGGQEWVKSVFDVHDLSGNYYIGVFGFEGGYNSYIKSITLYN